MQNDFPEIRKIANELVEKYYETKTRPLVHERYFFSREWNGRVMTLAIDGQKETIDKIKSLGFKTVWADCLYIFPQTSSSEQKEYVHTLFCIAHADMDEADAFIKEIAQKKIKAVFKALDATSCVPRCLPPCYAQGLKTSEAHLKQGIDQPLSIQNITAKETDFSSVLLLPSSAMSADEIKDLRSSMKANKGVLRLFSQVFPKVAKERTLVPIEGNISVNILVAK